MERPGPDVTVNLFGFRTVIVLPILLNWFSNWRLTLPAATRLFSRIASVSFAIIEGVRSELTAMLESPEGRRAHGASPLHWVDHADDFRSDARDGPRWLGRRVNPVIAPVASGGCPTWGCGPPLPASKPSEPLP